MKLLFASCLLCLFAAPAMAQEIMTFGHEAATPGLTQKQVYTRTRIPRGSTVIVNQCDPPMMYIGQSIQTLNNKRINKPVRIIRPGDAMSLDHNSQRLNFILDDGDIIRNIMCG